MSTVSVELELYLHIDASGARDLYRADMSMHGSHFGACLGKVAVIGTYEDIDKDPREALIESLEKQVDQERADSQVRINGLLDQIGKLKCLEYKA